ncbi:MAG: hypothetical protein IJB84_07830 [Lachnospiraceae bacterium]|nr:hypothetical protein [Lachnospiraceae bacterium]
MIDKMIIDADLCIKLGGHEKYKFLYDVLPMIAKHIYMHTHAHSEVLMPPSSVRQLKDLTNEGRVILVNESNLSNQDRAVYDATYKNLEKVMIDPRRPNKNKGEVCSLAYAKATGIPVFATDEMNLQPIIDKQLNTGIDDIVCIRIVDIINKATIGELQLSRKEAKCLWRVAGKDKDVFDTQIWPAGVEQGQT